MSPIIYISRLEIGSCKREKHGKESLCTKKNYSANLIREVYAKGCNLHAYDMFSGDL